MVLVTTGATFATSTDAGLELLERLKEREAAALGVGVGHYVETVRTPWSTWLARCASPSSCLP